MANKALDGVLIKKAHSQVTFSEKHIIDLQKCADPDTGYLYFLTNFYYIQHPVRGQLLYKPYDYQLRLLESYHNNRQSISLLPRQSGKTTTAAGYLLWYSMFHDDQTILVAAHKGKGALEIMQRIRYGYELCPNHIRCGVTGYNKGSIEFDNNSRIISETTTSDTGRGKAISLLYLDEFAFVQPNISDEFWSSISPTLSTGGKVIITSTPNSDEDTFATIWKESQHIYDEHGNEHPDKLGSNGFFGFQAYWWEHPDRDEAWKQAEIGKIGLEKFGREFECKFYVFEETLINSMKLEQMSGIRPLFETNNVRWYKKPVPGNIYLVGLDPSMGTGGDNAAIEIFELPSFTQIGEWQHNFTPVQKQVLLVKDILQYIVDETGDPNNVFWSTENNTVGEAALIVISDIGEDNFAGMLLSETPKKGYIKKFRRGFNTTFANKLSACSRLKYLIEEDKMKIFSKPFISELKSYIANKATFKAKSGMTDDLVSAALLIIRMSTILAEWDHRVYETLSIMDYEEEWIAPMPFMMTSFS